MGGGLFSIDLGQAETVNKFLTAIDADANQNLSNLLNLVGQLEQTWQSPNKASFINDWGTYCNALRTICNVGPNLVAGLTHEINLIQQAEGVQF